MQIEDYLLAAELLEQTKDEGFISVLAGICPDTKIKMPFSADTIENDISVLNISEHLFNALCEKGINTVGDVIDGIMSENVLDDMANHDNENISEVKTAVLFYGYYRLGEKEKAAFWLDIVKAGGMRNGK